MDEKTESGLSRVSIPALLVITALAGGLFTTWGPLQSSRPPNSKQDIRGAIGVQDVDARLWQDPFQAMLAANVFGKTKTEAGNATATGIADSHPEPDLPDERDIQTLSAQVKDHFDGQTAAQPASDPAAKSSLPKVTILLAFVAGGPYAEDTESRIRSRVAVVSGLSSSGYQPEDEQQIGYFTADWGRHLILDSKRLQESDWTQLIIPYEWFTRRIDGAEQKDEAQSNHVVVLWLRDNMFDDNPLLRLHQLVNYMQAGDDARVVVLGPRTSTMLRAFLPLKKADATVSPPAGAVDKFPTPISMYSWSATAMPALLLPDETPADLTRQMSENGIDFTNVTCADGELARTLLEELRLRNCQPDDGTHGPTIALVSEWDSFYGRVLPVTFSWMLAKNLGLPDTPAQLRADRNLWPKSLSTYSYLRGLDGLTSERTPATPEDNSKPTASKDQKRDVNRPEGTSQLDYVPRLADEMVHESERSLLKNNHGIKAIGVVGSDPYDKLLLLQALRPRFPDALFFTTDLDARFWSPKELPYTRNLIVASSFGLSLAPAWQKSVAPFRDTYQTAEYLACLAALGVVSKAELAQISPRVFEIGRNGPVDLSGGDRSESRFSAALEKRLQNWHRTADAVARSPGLSERPALYPNPRERLSEPDIRRRVLMLLLSGLLSVFLLGHMLAPCRRFLRGRREALEAEIALTVGDIRNQQVLMAKLAPVAQAQTDPICPYLSAAAVSVLTGTAKAGAISEQAKRLLIARNLNAFIRQHCESAAVKPGFWQRLISGPAKVLLASKQVRALDRWCERRSIRRQLENRFHVEKVTGIGLYGCSFSYTATRKRQRNFTATAWIPFLGLLGLGILILLDHQAPSLGEPFSWTDGVSAWPSQIIRFFVIVLSTGFAFRALDGLKMNDLALSREFDLPEPSAALRPAHGNSITRWGSNAVAVRGRTLWREYRWLGQTRNRLYRVLVSAGIYAIAVFFLFFGLHLMDLPLSPVRGVIATTVNDWMLRASILASTLLNFLVADATRLCCRFIENLSEAPTVYPSGAIRKIRAEMAGLESDDVDELIDMRLIAARSAEVSHMIYYPFVALLLLILARARYFDDWPWEFPLVFVFVMNAAWALSSALILQNGAKAAKAAVLKSLRLRWVQVRGENNPARAACLEGAIKDIEEMKSGALAGFSNNPLIGALSLPITGSAVSLLVNFLSGS